MQIQISADTVKNNFFIIESEIDFLLKKNFESIRARISEQLRYFFTKEISNEVVLKEIEDLNLGCIGLVVERIELEKIYEMYKDVYNTSIIDFILLEGKEMEIFLAATRK